ncbi:MAG: hypothetical protein LBM99_01550, partial [Bacillales bacterium]|nr:hypothetical protein [Bacillales bacterium]
MLLIFTAMILIAIFVKDSTLMSFINFLLIFIALIVALSFRKPLYAYNALAKTAKLVLNQSQPLDYKINIIYQDEALIKLGYHKYVTTEDFTLYFTNQ